MGFRNPIRSLPADDITGGQFTDAYTLSGTLVVGNPAGAHIKLDGSVPSEKLYAADGVTVLVDLEPTGPTFTGRLQTGLAGQRLVLDPDAVGLNPGYPTEALLAYSGVNTEVGPGFFAATRSGANPVVAIFPPYDSGVIGDQPGILIAGATAAGSSGGLTLIGSILLDGVHNIASGDSWHAPTLANGWTPLGGSWQAPQYTRLPTGEVIFQGAIAGGTQTVGTRLFTLPAGYRPLQDRIFGVISGLATLTRVDVHADGTVTLGSAANNNYLALAPIVFTAGF